MRPQSRPKSRYAALAVVAAAALMQSGCEAFLGTLFSGRIRECDGFDVPLGSLASSSRKELRVRVMGPRVQYDIPFVVESSADSFVLIGFTPLGTKAFSLDRKGDEVKVEKLMGPAQPVPPENLMADVLAMSIPSTCAQYADGVVTNDIGNWRLSDNCKDSRPLDRTITRLLPKASDKPEVVVEYQGDAIVVRQKQCNYIGRYMLQAVVVPGPPQPYVPTPVKPPTQSAAPKTPPAAAKPAAPAPTSAPATAPATPAAPGVAPAPATKPAEPAKDAKPAAPAAPSQPPAPATAPAQPQAAQPAPAPDAAPQVIIRHVPRERPSLRGMFKKKGAPTTTLPPQP